MDTAEMTSMLGFGTLIVGLIIALIILVRFMRKPENRHPMEGERERNIHEIREEAGVTEASQDARNRSKI